MKLGDTACRTLAAVLTLHARNGRVTVRDVAAEVGRENSATHLALVKLKAAGLIDWEQGKTGTLRPTCAVGTPHERPFYGTMGARGGGAAVTAPRRGQPPEPSRGANMAKRYPRTPSHARGQA